MKTTPDLFDLILSIRKDMVKVEELFGEDTLFLDCAGQMIFDMIFAEYGIKQTTGRGGELDNAYEALIDFEHGRITKTDAQEILKNYNK